MGVDPKDFERIAGLVEAKETADIMEMDPQAGYFLVSILGPKNQYLLQVGVRLRSQRL